METIRTTGGRRQWRGFIATPWSASPADHRTILHHDRIMAPHRVEHFLRWDNRAVVIVDRPSGGHGDEEKFLAGCLEVLRAGTRYVHFEQIALVLATSSRLSRLLQAADLLVSCSLTRVAGESLYSPPLFDALRPLFMSAGRVGGIAFKLHPDNTYANLYHWLLADDEIGKGLKTIRLPDRYRPYADGPDRA